VITGPAGIGKSRLVAEFRPVDADGREAAVHIGAARVHSPAPYDWLAALLSRRLPVGESSSQPSSAERLEDCVPADALAWLRQDVDVPRERYAPDALLRIAVKIVRAVVGDRPAVLVAEDLHALDPASLNLIAALAATALPVLLVVTARPSAAPLVGATLARLSGTPAAIRQHLAPLDRAAVALATAAVYGTADDAVVDEVLRRSGGNPHRLTELFAENRLSLPTEVEPPTVDLTSRELDVLGCLAQGLTNQQVASRLGISVRTVTVHVSNLLRKTRSRSRTDAALWAVRSGVESVSQ
jgi:DNA-binding NarL/FixJ family response regulator